MDRLFVSDLDGTLLDRSARLSEWSRERLGRLLGSGMPFTVASARSIHTIASILDGVAIQLPVIEFNGAFITDLRTRSSLMCHALDAGSGPAGTPHPPSAGAASFWSLSDQLACTPYSGSRSRDGGSMPARRNTCSTKSLLALE